ncbi:unannotated protein [freshwater metagenome]|uniref:Unannotated protein n=1 Tax=freshwater metagenome TaxID=449393 RepID=A0A6J7C3B0_9ZZZZ
MGTTGLEMDLEQGSVPKGLEGLIVGDTRFAVTDDRPPILLHRMAVDRRVNGAARGIHLALHHRVVDLLDGAVLELALEQGVGTFALRDDHQTGRADVETVHDPLTLSRARGRDPVASARESTHDRGPVPPRRGVGRDAHGLVDNDDVVVVVHDAQTLDCLSDDHDGGWGVGKLNLEPTALSDPR